MTCLEAQSKIIAYIDDKLEKEEKQEFLQHVQHCDECREELVIYYTMIVGMRQLDNNLPLPQDFTKELDERMERELKSSRKKKGLLHSSVITGVVALLVLLILGYANFLNLLHDQEQKELKEKQGEYYYSETFHGILFFPEDEDKVLNIHITTDEPEESFYEKIRKRNVLK